MRASALLNMNVHQKANSADDSYQDVGQVNVMAVNVEECEDEFLVLRRIKNAPTTRSHLQKSKTIHVKNP